MDRKINRENDIELLQNRDQLLQSKPSKQYDFFPISFWQKESLSSYASERDSKDESNQQQLNQRANIQIKTLYSSNETLKNQRSQFKSRKTGLDKGENRGSRIGEMQFMRAFKIQSLILKFKNNLYASAYILPQKFKQIIYQEEQYQEKQQNYEDLTIHDNDLYVSKFQQFLMPGTNQMILLDLIILAIYLISLWICLYISTFISIEHTFYGSELFFIGFLILELLFSFYRPLIVNGEVIINSKLIWQQYLQKKTIFEDIANIILWFLIFMDLHDYFLFNEIVTIILSIILIRKIVRKYDIKIEQLYLKGINSNFIDFITLFVMILIFAHIMACIWHYIGNLNNNKTWLTVYNLQDLSTLEKYNYSYYWAIVTMVTVGYGDITPQNNIEVCCVTIMITFSSIMFAYSINSIGVLVKNISEQKFKYKKNVILLNSFMRKYDVDIDLQRRITNHIKQISEKDQYENREQMDQSINQLPLGLKQDLERNIKTKIIKKNMILKSQFSKQLLNQTSIILEMEKFTPNQIIYKKDQCNQYLYFLNFGTIKLIEQQSGKVLKILRQGDTFGEYQFFTGHQAKESCITCDFAEVYKIERNLFLKIIKQNRKDYEKFCQIKDSILLYQNYSNVYNKCTFCNSSHSSIDCSLMTYQPNQYFIILKSLSKKHIFREYYKRKMKKFNSLVNINQVKDIVSDIQETLTQSEEDQQIQTLINEVDQNEDQQQNQLIMDVALQQQKSSHSIKKRRQSVNNYFQDYEINSQCKPISISNLKNIKEVLNQFDNQKSVLNCQLDEFKQRFSHQITNFECIQQYQEYFPQNNLNVVLKKYNQFQINQQNKKIEQYSQKSKDYQLLIKNELQYL